MKTVRGLNCPVAVLQEGIRLFRPEEREEIVDNRIFARLSTRERRGLCAWMAQNGNGAMEKYYLTLILVANAASRRGDTITRDSMLEVVQDIERGGTASSILLTFDS